MNMNYIKLIFCYLIPVILILLLIYSMYEIRKNKAQKHDFIIKSRIMHILKTEKSILKIKTYQNEYIYIDTNNHSSNNSSSCKDGTHSYVEVKDKGLILHLSTNSQNMYINNDLNNHGISIILIKIPYQNIKYIGGIIDNDNISKCIDINILKEFITDCQSINSDLSISFYGCKEYTIPSHCLSQFITQIDNDTIRITKSKWETIQLDTVQFISMKDKYNNYIQIKNI